MQKTFLKKQLFFTILFIISILYNIINKNKLNTISNVLFTNDWNTESSTKSDLNNVKSSTTVLDDDETIKFSISVAINMFLFFL